MFETLETRETVKGLLTFDNGNVLLVAGPSGRLNLAGGGVDPLETHEQALLRELKEETGLDADVINGLKWPGIRVEGMVTYGDGSTKLARWTVATGRLACSFSDIAPQTQHEIMTIASLPFMECLRMSSGISTLAQCTIAQYLAGGASQYLVG